MSENLEMKIILKQSQIYDHDSTSENVTTENNVEYLIMSECLKILR